MINYRFLLISCLAASLLGCGNQQNIQTYTITTGMDGDAIHTVIEEARTSQSSKVEIVFQDGAYHLTHPIILNNSKGSVPQMTFRAENPRKASLSFDKSMSRKLNPVTSPDVLKRMRPEAQGWIMEIDLSELNLQVPAFPELFQARSNFPQLIYQGEILPLSRYPNEGYLYMNKVLDNFGTADQGGTFEYTDHRHAAWKDAVKQGLWFTGYWRVPWQAWTVRIKEIDTNKKTVTHAVGIDTKNGKDVGVFGGIGSKYHRPSGSGEEPYYVENLLEEIDLPCEWCIDFNEQKLYLLPPTDFNEAALSLVWNNEPMFRLEDVSGVTIENLILKNHLGTGILSTGGHGNLIAGCLFENILGNAVFIAGGEKHTVLSNDFIHIGRTCVEISGGDRAKLIPAHHRVENNYFTQFGEIQQSYAPAVKLGAYTTGIGVEDGNAVGITVSHNLVHNAPHAAFIYGGNNNLLEHNEVFDIARLTGDVGAFYARWDWTSRGNTIRNNFIHHTPRANAIYSDDGHSGDSVYGNVVYRAMIGTIIGGGHANYVHNNLYVECIKTAIHIDSRGKQRNYNASNPDFTDLFHTFNITEGAWEHQFPGMNTYLSREHLDLPLDNDIGGNTFVNCPIGIRKEGKPEDFRYSTFSENLSLTLPDFDFSTVVKLKDLSGLPQRMDRKPFELEKCGLYTDSYRKELPNREALLKTIPTEQQAGFDSNTDQQATNEAN